MIIILAYTHRIGRTGRMGREGCSITLLTNEDNEMFWDLKVVLEKSKISKVPAELERVQKPGERNLTK